MPVSKELLEYQQVDSQLRKIELELASSEERKKYMQAKKFIEVAREKLESQEKHAEELRNLREEYDDLDEMLEEGADIAFYKKNAQTLLDKLRTVKSELARLIAEVTSVSEEYKKFKEQTIAMQKQYKEYSEKYKAVKNARAAEVDEITKKLAALAKKIEPAILERYQQKRKERIFPIVVPLTGDYCMCGFEFPKFHMSELAGGNMVECENCRRYIYKP